jgi:hypothetical protein
MSGEPVPVPLCTPQSPQRLSLGLKPGLLKVSPATKRLSHSTAWETEAEQASPNGRFSKT